MPDSVRPRRRANALSSRAPDPANLLARILDTPHLAEAVPRLQAEVLHRVIQHCGLEACHDLIALVTPAQLSAVFDLDLWGNKDEQFDADRFAVWLEVLAESGAEGAAGKLAEIDAGLVIAALSKNMRVIDTAAGIVDRSDRDVGGYRLVARRGDLSETMVAVLLALEEDHAEYFHRVMRGCRKLSNSTPEPDGFHDLLEAPEQALFDLALDREIRREQQGFVTPAQAHAFLQMSRAPVSDDERRTSLNPVAAGYFRAIEWNPPPELTVQAADVSGVTGVAGIVDVLVDAGILPNRPQALLTGTTVEAPRFADLRRLLDFLGARDHAAHSARSQELAFLANAILGGASVQDRPFTAQEASDGAVAVCNLGLQHMETAPPEDFLVEHDLVKVFQSGWRVLHVDVCRFAAERLIDALNGLRYSDREIQADLDTLYIELSRHLEEPWRSRKSFEVLAILDLPAWASLLGLINEFPVMHASLSASMSGKRSVDANAFEFISEKSQIATMREFLTSLPDALSR
jgi:uncharacterized protein DUF6178